MKIFDASAIRALDAYTIAHEPVSGLELMERAARASAGWLRSHAGTGTPFFIFCGTGNNGGDGLAVARLLCESGEEVCACIVAGGKKWSPDAEENRRRLEPLSRVRILHIETAPDLPDLPAGGRIVDALFGTGLNRPLEGLAAAAVDHINRQHAEVISIDIPSGMRADAASKGGPVVRASHTLSFQFYKLAFLMPENAPYTGSVHLLPIGLHPGFIRDTETPYHWVDQPLVRELYRPRDAFSHKGTFGHALLVAGSYGKIGAAVLSARACSRAGAGLVTVRIPAVGYEVMQASVPEAMCDADASERFWVEVPGGLERYNAVGVGPGIGMEPATAAALERLLESVKRPMILDADALNIIGQDKRLLDKIPPESVLTPHPKEFERLFGKTEDDFARLALQREVSARYRVHIVLKGHHTIVSAPSGHCWFNSTGNAGMATGGSGDVLTGILTGLLAQGYAPREAAVTGVYLHGLAGDLAAAGASQESLIAPDLPRWLGSAFKCL